MSSCSVCKSCQFAAQELYRVLCNIVFGLLVCITLVEFAAQELYGVLCNVYFGLLVCATLIGVAAHELYGVLCNVRFGHFAILGSRLQYYDSSQDTPELQAEETLEALSI
jgi:hypothetical protein